MPFTADSIHDSCRNDVQLICQNLPLDGVEQRVFNYLLLDPKASTYPCVCVTLEGETEEELYESFEEDYVVYPVGLYLIDRASTDFQPTSKNWLKWRRQMAHEFRRRTSLPNTPQCYDIRLANRVVVDPRLAEYQLVISAFTVRCYTTEPRAKDYMLPTFPVPDAPTNLVAIASPTVTLTWTPPYGFKLLFSVFRGTAPGGEDLQNPLATGVKLPTYQDTPDTNGVRYYYRVAAVNANGRSGLSNEASALPGLPPATPIGFVAGLDGDKVALSWLAVSGSGISYNLYRGFTPGGEGLLPYVVGIAGTAYLDAAVTPGITYYYTLTAEDSGGQESPSSSEAFATPLFVPGAPTNVAAMSGQDSSVPLTWNPAPGATGYNILRGTASGGEVFLATTTATAFIDATAANAVRYFYQVVALGPGGPGPASLEVSAMPTLPPVPAVVHNLTATPGNNRVVLAWSPAVRAVSYRIQRSTVSGMETYYSGPQSGTTFTDTGVVAGTKYYYKVRGVDSRSRNGGLSAEVFATPTAPPMPPPAPTNLAPTAGNGQVSLIWNAAAGATSYNVYRGLASGSETLLHAGVNVTSYVDGTAVNGTPYFYVVTAVNAVGESPSSNEVSSTASLPPAPTAPQNFTATPGDTIVLLSWSAVANASSYSVYRSFTPGGETTPLQTGITGTTFTDTGLTDGTTYYYEVAAVDAFAQVGAFSAERNATPAAPPPPIPPAPANLVATPAKAKINLTWNASSGATSYEVYKGTTSGGESGTPLATVTGATYSDSSVTNGQVAYYKVKAVNSSGSSPYSGEASATPTIAAVQNLTATAGNGQVTLTWTARAFADTYNVLRSTTSGTESFLVNVATNSLTDTGLANGTTYYYEVQGVNAAGSGSTSAEVSAVPLVPPSAPLAPANLVAVSNHSGEITLTFDPSAGATGYNVYRGTTPGGQSGTPLNGTPLTSPTFTDTGLANGTPLYYKVTATNSTGESPRSAEATATPTLVAVTGLVATAGDTQVSLAWSSLPDAVSYKVYKGTTPGGETLLASGITGTSYTATGLPDNTPYYFKVAGVDTYANVGTLSAEVSATPVSPLPAAPSALAAVAVSGSEIDLTWVDNSTNETGFKLQRSPDGSTGWTLIATLGAGVTSYADVGLAAGTAYFYRVRSYNAAGNSAYSNTANATTQATPVVAVTKGIFYVGFSTQPIPGSALSKTLLDGVATRMFWDAAEPTEGNLAPAFSYFDSERDKALAAGRTWTLSLTSGTHAPPWVYNAGAVAFTGGLSGNMPIPWDTVYLAKWRNTIAALGTRYGSSTNLRHVKLVGVHNRTQATVDAWIAAGYRPSKVLTAAQGNLTAAATAFPDKQLAICIVGGGFPNINESGVQPSSGLFSTAITQAMATYMVSTYPFPRGVLMNNGMAMKADGVTPFIESDVAAQGNTITTGYQTTTSLHADLPACLDAAMAANARFFELYSGDIGDASLATKLQSVHNTLGGP